MAPSDTDRVAELLATDGFEERVSLRGRLGFLAFHGGLEGGTEETAEAAADSSDASVYALVQPPTLRWHLPSHVIGAGASPALRRFLDHVDVAVALHGYGRRERPRDILVGGANRVLAGAVAAALRPRLPDSVVVDDLDAIPAGMRGLHPTNPVNLCRQGGVQLELPPGVRGASWRWEDRGPCTPQPALIEALAEIAAAWTATAVRPPAHPAIQSTSHSPSRSTSQSTSNVPPDRQ
jgi:phage replication-related protein YjqB (UPF0714/DUF867 family)